jgi:hypothetical protein
MYKTFQQIETKDYEAWQIIKVPIFNLQSSAQVSTFL